MLHLHTSVVMDAAVRYLECHPKWGLQCLHSSLLIAQHSHQGRAGLRAAAHAWHASRSNVWSPSILPRCLRWFEHGGAWWSHVDLGLGSCSRSVWQHVRMSGPVTPCVEARRCCFDTQSAQHSSLAPRAQSPLRVPASAQCIACSTGSDVAMLELAMRLREIAAYCWPCSLRVLQLHPGTKPAPSIRCCSGRGGRCTSCAPPCKGRLVVTKSRLHGALHDEMCHDAVREFQCCEGPAVWSSCEIIDATRVSLLFASRATRGRE
jgi:hypothetical protein